MRLSTILRFQKIGMPSLLPFVWETSNACRPGPDERILSDGLENGVPRILRWEGMGDRNISRLSAGLTVWMTGISGSGKTTIAAQLEQQFPGIIYRLDGDNLRKGLNSDLGFSDNDRNENNRRTAEVAKLMNDSGLIVICALISPFAADRELARRIHEASSLDFMEVYVDTPLSVAEKRDAKGLYKRARNGEIRNFTGISSPYEVPEAPDIHIHTDKLSVNDSVKKLLHAIQNRTEVSNKECDEEAKRVSLTYT